MKRRDFIMTAAIPPGDPSLFKMALELHDKIEPLKKSELQIIKEEGAKGLPLFKYSV
jgi:hypothetical protein